MKLPHLRRLIRRAKSPAQILRARTPLVLMSNREPFVHNRGPDGELQVSHPAGGLTSALQPLMASTGGTWIAWGSGSADFEVTDERMAVGVPPEQPTYRLRRIRLSEEELRGYYIDTANRALWPLCHSQLHRFRFDAAQWKIYKEVNERFALAALAEAGHHPATVWVHDYHLAQVPAVLRQAPRLFVHQFWHIPWPPTDILRILPVAEELLRGLLGNDLLVLQTSRDLINFLASVADFLPESKVDFDESVVRFQDHTTTLRAHPISIDVDAFERLAVRPDVLQLARGLARRYLPDGGQLVLGVDRIDYTKGIPRRFESYARLLEEHPELRSRAAFLQIAVPSRSEVPDYAEFAQEVGQIAENINRRFATADWRPIHLIQEHHDAATLAAHYRVADVCVVSSLQDGMNLVAKEFVACQRDGLGVLVLSRFAGAAEELNGALLINPYDLTGTAKAIYRALTMRPPERQLRLKAMRKQLTANTIHTWMDAILDDVERLRRRRK